VSITELDVAAEPTGEPTVIQGKTPWQLAWYRLSRDKVAIVSAVVIVLIVLSAIFAPVLVHWWGYPPKATDTTHGLSDEGLPLGPGSKHLLGTDQLGRDLFSRAVYGARVSLIVGISATLLSTIFGTALGIVAGYIGGWVDAVISRFLEIALSFPYLIAALVLAATIGPSMTMEIFVIAFFSFAATSRVIRGQVIAIKAKEYIEAARSLGAGTLRIMFIDVLPNLVAPVIVLGTMSLPLAITFESTLTFLGAGTDIRTPSWGGMLSESTQYFRVAPMYLFVPGLLLLITTLAFNLVGDGVRDALDPSSDRVFAKAGK
jgi:peptide/nickel transport system permease protein